MSNMKLWCLANLLCFLLPNSQGFLYQVKSPWLKKFICYTNETRRAVAFVGTPLGEVKSEKSSTVQYRPILNEGIYIGVPCHISQNNYTGWNTGDFIEEQSIHASKMLPPIFDRRWNYLTEYVTNGDKIVTKITQLHQKASGTLHFSVLAIHSVLVIFSQDDFKTGFVVAVDGFHSEANLINKASLSKLRYCKDLTSATYVTNCTILSETNHKTRILSYGTAWNLISIEYNLSLFGLNVSFNNKTILTATYQHRNFSSDWIKSLSWNVGVRTFGTKAVFKVHEYGVLRPKDRHYRKIVSDIVISSAQQRICLDLTYFCAERTSNESISVGIINATKYVKENISLSTYEKGVWTHGRVESKALPMGKYNLSITIIAAYIYLGDISVCPEGSEIVTSADTDVKKCTLLGDAQTNPVQPKFNGLSETETEAFCKNHSNCYDVEFCSEQQCACLSGHKRNAKQQCMDRCTGGNFGADCSGFVRRFCRKGYSVHTGECTNGCLDNYRPQDCTKMRYKIPNDPQIYDFGLRHALLNIESVRDGLLQNYNPSEIDTHLKSIEVHLKNETDDWNNWTAIDRQSLKNTSALNLTNLKPNSTYLLRLVVVEDDDWRTKDEFSSSRFSTLQCLPISEHNTEILQVKHSLQMKMRNDSDDFEYTCAWTHLNITCGPPTHKSELNKTGVEFELTDNDTMCQFEILGADGTTTIFNSTYIAPKIDEPVKGESEGNDDGKGGSGVVIGIVVSVLLGTAIIALVLFWRRKKKMQNAPQLLRKDAHYPNGSGGMKNAVKMSEIAGKQEVTNGKSKIVKIEELENYIEEVLRTDIIRKQHEMFPRGQTQPWVVGTKPVNKSKNRYGNLAAYDATRVILDLILGDPDSDYINANYINGYKRPGAYIATQGPKPVTVVDFWRMIWQDNVTVIVMVANCVEDKKTKCEKYWPDQHGTLTFGDFTVGNDGEEVFADHVCRSLVLSKAEWNRKITHMHFTTWPDHHVPMYPQSLAVFVKSVNRIPTESPIVVHCSAGVGRTGTFILVDICVRMAKAEKCVDILGTLSRIRQQRPNMVDNAEQYKFAHEVILECLLMPQLTMKCKDYDKKLEELKMQKKYKLRKMYERVCEVSHREWTRKGGQADIEADKCRIPEYVGSLSHFVRLFPYGPNPVSFINAVYVDAFRQKAKFVATQVPMEHTAEHFWRMVLQHRAEWIIVLNEAAEGAEPPEAQYLPEPGEMVQFGELQIGAQEGKDGQKCAVYTIFENGVKQGEVSIVCHKGWAPGDPSGPGVESLVEMWEDTQRRLATRTTVFVCHDGVTACGLFLGVGFVLEKLKLEQRIDPVMATRVLRYSRPAFIQNMAQFEILFDAAKVYLQMFDTYGNFQ